MKWIIIFVLCSFCLLFAYFYSSKYKKRLKFWQSLVTLCEKLDVDINFSREKLKNLIQCFDIGYKTQLCGLDKNYVSYLEGENELSSDVLFKGITFLKEGEKQDLFMFFKNLGRTDCENQTKEIKNFKLKFEEDKKHADEENKKYGSVIFKLGIVGALFVIVIFI